MRSHSRAVPPGAQTRGSTGTPPAGRAPGQLSQQALKLRPKRYPRNYWRNLAHEEARRLMLETERRMRAESQLADARADLAMAREFLRGELRVAG